MPGYQLSLLGVTLGPDRVQGMERDDRMVFSVASYGFDPGLPDLRRVKIHGREGDVYEVLEGGSLDGPLAHVEPGVEVVEIDFDPTDPRKTWLFFCDCPPVGSS